ncbi:MAG: thiamine ABC transporter ATP-binding protein [Aeromonadaceae bacterium]
MPETPELRCRALTLSRGPDNFTFTLTLQPGELLVVIGPSGAGKSTLLDLLAGFATPESGELTLDGVDLLALPPAKRPFTTLFQSHNLFEHLSVAQNIGLGVNPKLKLTPAQEQEVVEAASRLGLAELLARRPTELSGGQQQRVALARCLVRARPFLLLDEPFSALDPALRQEMLLEVQRVAHEAGIGVLLISHHPEEARQVADRLALLQEGEICYLGPVSELDNHANDDMARYLGRAMSSER